MARMPETAIGGQLYRDSHQLKFIVLAEGTSVSAAAAAHLTAATGARAWSPNDYASTSGLILQLDGDVWVNAPIHANNPNFVADEPRCRLDFREGRLWLECGELSSQAYFWIPPAYQGKEMSIGRPYNHFVVTHGDRVRLSPMQGCAMVCKFCNIPYEDRYSIKPLSAMIDAIDEAFADSIQPARHMLISGGTPKTVDFSYLQNVYREMLVRYSDIDIDIMMVPADGLLDVRELADLGLHELSINIEIVDQSMARSFMRQKLQHGLDHYLTFIEEAARILGEGRVRSMLMVGLEPHESTVRGVELIAAAGGVPVLSPFRPAPTTPLAGIAPASAEALSQVHTDSAGVMERLGGRLGPACLTCAHNTLSLPGAGDDYRYPVPRTA